MLQEQALTRCAAKRSADADGEVDVTRRGQSLCVALYGRWKDRTTYAASTRAFSCRSAGLARRAVAEFERRRAVEPDKNPVIIMRQSIAAIEAGWWQAHKRVRGKRIHG